MAKNKTDISGEGFLHLLGEGKNHKEARAKLSKKLGRKNLSGLDGQIEYEKHEDKNGKKTIRAKLKSDTSMDQMKASAERMAKYNKFKDEQMAQGKTSKEATAAWNYKQMTNYLAVEDKKNNITDTKDNENKVISDMQAQSNGVMDNSTLVKINKNLEKANKINEVNAKANQKTSKKDTTVIAATKNQSGSNVPRVVVNQK